MGYYVLQEGGREDQLARQLKVILVKLPREEKRRRKKEERERVVKRRPLGSIVKRKRQGKRREKERDGLGGRPRPRLGQVCTNARVVALDRNRNEIILSKNSIQCRFFRPYLSISDADNPFSGARMTAGPAWEEKKITFRVAWPCSMPAYQASFLDQKKE